MRRMSVVMVLALCVLGLCSFAVSQVKPKARAAYRPASGPATRPTSRPAMPKDLTLDLGKGVTMTLVPIPAGKFMMGSPRDEEDRGDEEGLARGQYVNGSPQVEATISKPFYLGVYEVTVDQYAEFVRDTGYKSRKEKDFESGASDDGNSWRTPEFSQAGGHPVTWVSWDEANSFCTWLSKKTGKTVRLPTEAQWEYACRAGSKTAFGYGDDAGYSNLGDYAWYTSNSKSKTHPVGQKKPNAWGLYDMHGNVWEWCSDWFADSYANAGLRDPQGPGSGTGRVLRGGSWYVNPRNCRSAFRDWRTPNYQFNDGGFRIAVDLK